MWIMLNDAFFSIVSKDCKPDEVLVRARIKGDIEKVFNAEDFLAATGLKSVEVTRYTKSDYLYRAVVPRAHIKAVMSAEVDRVVYSNFKASTRDSKLHSAYNAVWSIMAKLQELPPYSGFNRLKGAQPSFFAFDDYFSPDAHKAAAAIDKKAKAKKPAKK